MMMVITLYIHNYKTRHVHLKQNILPPSLTLCATYLITRLTTHDYRLSTQTINKYHSIFMLHTVKSEADLPDFPSLQEFYKRHHAKTASCFDVSTQTILTACTTVSHPLQENTKFLDVFSILAGDERAFSGSPATSSPTATPARSTITKKSSLSVFSPGLSPINARGADADTTILESSPLTSHPIPSLKGKVVFEDSINSMSLLASDTPKRMTERRPIKALRQQMLMDESTLQYIAPLDDSVYASRMDDEGRSASPYKLQPSAYLQNRYRSQYYTKESKTPSSPHVAVSSDITVGQQTTYWKERLHRRDLTSVVLPKQRGQQQRGWSPFKDIGGVSMTISSA